MTGRQLPARPFAGDPGEPDPALAAALAGHAAGSTAAEQVVAALAGARLMVAVVATAPDVRSDAGTGLPAESRAEMALVTLTGRDGGRALPVFSGTASLRAWNPQARPVPVESARAAQACVAEGCDRLLLDPAGPVGFEVPRPAVWALGQGRDWVPSPADPTVTEAVERACDLGGPVLGVTCEPGRRAELRVVLRLAAGLGPAELQAVLARVGERLAAEPVVAERVASLELAPIASSDAADGIR